MGHAGKKGNSAAAKEQGPRAANLLLVKRVAALATVVCLATMPAHAADRVIVKHYVGAPTSAGLVFCGAPRSGADGAGRACVLTQPGETTIEIAIEDTVPAPVAGRVVFFGRETGLLEPEDILGSQRFCGRLDPIAIPDGTTHLDVEIGDRPGEAMGCSTLTEGTYGSVTVTLR